MAHDGGRGREDVPISSFRGPAYLHLPLEVTDPLDFGALYDTENRWNRRGQPTLYLAGDPGVALAELARHLPPPTTGRIERRLMRFEVHLGELADIRGASSAEPATHDFLDREVACDAAESLRRGMRLCGLLVPSMAFLDRPDRHNIVVFLEQAGDAASWIEGVSEVGRIVLEAE